MRIRPVSPARVTARLPVIGAVLAGLSLAGCGHDVYEQRLDNTRILYQHLDQLDANLHGPWSDDGATLQLRVPKQFEVVAAPKVPAGGEPTLEPVADDRQPTYLNLELPGLRGTFRAPLAILGGGDVKTAPGWLYVLSNQLLDDSPEKAADFRNGVTRLVSDSVRTSFKDEDWRDEEYPPRRGTFAPSVRYMGATINPPDPFGSDVKLESQVRVDVFSQGAVQVVLLWILPRDVDSSERIAQRMDLCRETLRVASSKLGRPAGATGPTGGKAGAF